MGAELDVVVLFFGWRLWCCDVVVMLSMVPYLPYTPTIVERKTQLNVALEENLLNLWVSLCHLHHTIRRENCQVEIDDYRDPLEAIFKPQRRDE